MRIADKSPLQPRAKQPASQEKGLLLIQIDGLSHNDLHRAVDEGLMPNMQKWLKNGQLTESPYQCTQPSQTVVSQSGVLMGLTLPANQWFIKGGDWNLINPMGLGNPDQVENELAARGDGGILQGGHTYMSPLAGGADPKNTYFALSTLAAAKHQHGTPGLLKEALREFSHISRCLIQHPTQLPHTVANVAHGTADEYRTTRELFPEKTKGAAFKQAFKSNFVDGYVDDACTRSMENDMKHGVPVLYKDYESYDGRNHEVADPAFSRRSLKNVDRNIGILMNAAKRMPRKYNVVIYADHGCCPGEYFKDLYGQSFPDFVQSALPASIPPSLSKADGTKLPPFLTQDIGSGCNIYFTNSTQALDRSTINRDYPGVISKLENHPGIAFVMTRDGSATMLESPKGTVRVDGGKVTVTGENPLKAFGEGNKMALQLSDMMHREHQGDICVVGKQLGEGQMVNFGVLPGLHGGIGGNQQSPMIAFAPDLPIHPEALNDSAELHQQLMPLVPDDAGVKLRAQAS